MKQKKEITFLAIALVFTSMMLVHALSVQAPGTYVVKLGNNEAVQRCCF